MKQITQISPERAKQLEELEQFENAAITIAVISKDLIDKIFAKHKELKVGFADTNERIAWQKVRDGAASLDHVAFNSPNCDYKRFKKSVLMVKFLMLELIARCDDNNMRVWQFHNLLKTFKLVYPAVAPTVEDEQQSFADLFGKADNSAENG
jgi:hypothetical protein